ncbi:MAG: leucine-rich repeat protein [Clostridia bacterium]|nr:leucine-rich repeat protein [Clostridia bacterium]
MTNVECVTSIGGNAFKDRSVLRSVTIPEELTYIGEYALNSCRDLTYMSLPLSAGYIGRYAFNGCNYDSAFSGCFNLKDAYYTGLRIQWNNIIIGEYNNFLTDAAIHYNSSP